MAKNGTTATKVNGQKRLLFVLFVGLSCWPVAQHAHHVYTMGPQKLCGQALTDALEVVCAKGYNGISLPRLTQKRAQLGPLEEQLEQLEQQQQPKEEQQQQTEQQPNIEYSVSPLLSSIYGTEVLIKTMRRQRRQGVYDECCLNSCTYTELVAYCR